MRSVKAGKIRQVAGNDNSAANLLAVGVPAALLAATGEIVSRKDYHVER